jgi:asparagine synthase (glutamine-hydrolysing)
MCGIVGVVGPDAESYADAIDAEASLMDCRGPDANGVFRDHGVVLAHRRLSILDLTSRSNQPFRTGDGRYVLTFNGEIYNFRDIDSTAESDTIALMGYPVAATDPRRLRGMFAYALWDARRRRLSLVRDRFGMKPLYFGSTGPNLVFGSTVGCVARLLHLSTVSLPALASFLRLGSVQGPDTIFAGVHEVDPGTVVHWYDGGYSSERYWAWEDAYSPPDKDLGATLRDAVTVHCVSDVPVAVFLSGGLDSAIISVLAQEAELDVTALTLGFPGLDIDETEEATTTARALGVKHEVIETGDPMAQGDRYFGNTDQPSIDGLNTYLIAQAAASRGFRVALSGLGADELFAGYSTFRRIPAMATLNTICPAPLASWVLGRVGGNPTKTGELARCGADFVRLHEELRSVFSPGEVARLIGVQWYRSDKRAQHEPIANAVTRLEFEVYLRNTLLRDSDIFSMAHSLELRTPFVDHVVLQSALALSGSAKLLHKKRLVADALQNPRLRRLARMRKRGFSLPYGVWLRGAMKSRVDDLVYGPLATTCDRTVVGSYVDRWRASQEGEMKVWSLVVLDAWLRKSSGGGGM